MAANMAGRCYLRLPRSARVLLSDTCSRIPGLASVAKDYYSSASNYAGLNAPPEIIFESRQLSNCLNFGLNSFIGL